MPKIIDYPKSTLENAMLVAISVDGLGGSSNIDVVANKMGKKVSGAFTALIASASRYGLLNRNKGVLSTTELYRNYKLSYDDVEKRQNLKRMFLEPPIFSELVNKFSGIELPTDQLHLVLVREFGIPDNMGTKVAMYFIEGAKQCGLLNENNIIVSNDSNNLNQDSNEDIDDKDEVKSQNFKESVNLEKNETQKTNNYNIRIRGPGMDSLIDINDADDIEIVKIMLKKIEKLI